jgi:hypothetical protein
MCARGSNRAPACGPSTYPLDGMTSVFVVTAQCVSISADTLPTSDGAYLNVYATVSSEAEATSIAVTELAAAGWRCLKVQRVTRHTREDYENNPKGLEYFEQALQDGVVLVVHTFPRKGPQW